MKKILLIGAGGYIGSTLCHLLLQKGYYVRAIDNFFKGHCDALLPFVSDNNFEFKFGDITSYADMEKAVNGVDLIVPLSALVGFPICNKYKALAWQTNVEGIINLIDTVNETQEEIPIVYPSTGSVYGEVKSGLCTEETETKPLSLYGETKLEAEYHLLHNYTNAIIHRYATACGIGYNATRVNLLINDLVYQAMNNKCLTIFQADFKRTFCHVIDICRAIVHTIENFDTMLGKYRVYNVGNQTLNYSKRDIAEMIRDKTGCHVTYAETGSDLDSRNYEVDYSRIYDSGWSPVYDMEYIINELIKATPLLTGWNRYN